MTGLAKTKCPATEMEAGGTKKDGATMIVRTTATHNPIDRVLDCLDGVEQNGSGFKASCPVPGHRQGRGDRNPSLSASEGDGGKVVIYCRRSGRRRAEMGGLSRLPCGSVLPN